jgi:hypothetical protein
MLRKMDTYAVADAMQLPMNGESLHRAPAARPFSHTRCLGRLSSTCLSAATPSALLGEVQDWL